MMRSWVAATAAAVVAVNPTAVYAVSSGDVGMCNPHGNIGCNRWRGGNRLSCSDPTQGPMPWATKPTRSADYTLTAPQASGVYIPGTLVTLQLQVHAYKGKYRGVIIDAVNASNNTVGSFRFTSTGTPETMFWEAPRCPGTVAHRDAELKPFIARFTYAAPPSGTGRIRFRCLLKTGPANKGDFWYPEIDPVLEEMQISAQPQPVTVAAIGTSCTAHCRTTGQECDATRMTSVTGLDGLREHVNPYYACPPPAIVECSAAAPGLDNNGTCLFLGTAESCPGGVAVGASECAAATGAARCDAVHPGIRRFCACTPPPTAAPTEAPTPQPTSAPTIMPTPGPTLLPTTAGTTPAATTTATNDSNTGGGGRRRKEATSAAVIATSNRLVIAGAALLGSFATSGSFNSRSATTLLVLTFTFFGAEPVTAHNWLQSPSRAMTEASTTMPCRSRKSDKDLHAQVGPGQEFIVKWAVGHERAAYWVVLHGSNESWLAHPRFYQMVNAYINQAPPGADRAQNPHWQRYHGVISNGRKRQIDAYLQTSQTYYDSEVSPSDPNFLNHSHSPTLALYRFTNNTLANDRYVSYASAAYPWIESAFRYTIDSQNNAAARDFDAVRVDIPGRAGPGHYIVHWRWSGYADCVDVELMTSPVPQNLINGVTENGNVWGRIDHCQYTMPFREVLSRCLPADGGAQACLDAVNQAYYNSTASNEFAGLTPRFLDRIGINVVPLSNPATVAFPNRTAIPWTNATCANGPLSRITGEVTFDTSAATLTARLGTPVGGRACTNYRAVVFRETTTARAAIQRCSIMRNCRWLVWDRTAAENASNANLWDGEHVFRGCDTWGMSQATTQTQLLSVVYERPAAFDPMLNMSDRGAVEYFSFQPTPSPMSAGWHADVGDIFGNRGGGWQYGWKCSLNPSTYLRGSGGVNSTRLSNLHLAKCPDGSRNRWEVAVPNGVYRVVAWHNSSEIRGQSCIVENIQLVKAEVARGPRKSYKIVEVRDGRFTLEAIRDLANYRDIVSGFMHRTGCTLINWVSIQRIGTESSLPQLWFPGSNAGGAWRQERFATRTAVGLVSIEFPVNIDTLTSAQIGNNGFITNGAVDGNGVAVGQPHKNWNYDCRMRWFYERSGCSQLTYRGQRNMDSWNSEKRSRPFGNFSGAMEGAVVSVADTPCGSTGCPGGTICSRITAVDREFAGLTTTGRGLNIDCHGAVGMYLRVHLPGSGRIFAAAVSANRAKVEPSVPGQNFVCYAVRARIATQTTPEYTVTSDPLDPVYYSTCYVRERKITWLPSPVQNVATKPQWALSGNMCESCATYQSNQLESDAPNNVSVPTWVIANECVDCTSPASLGEDSVNCSAYTTTTAPTLPAPTTSNGPGAPGVSNAPTTPRDNDDVLSEQSTSSDDNSATGIAVAIVFFVLLAVVVGTIVYRRRQGLPANPFGRAFGKPAQFKANRRRQQKLSNEVLSDLDRYDATESVPDSFANPVFVNPATPNITKPSRPAPAPKPVARPRNPAPKRPAPMRKPVPQAETSTTNSVALPRWEAAIADGEVYFINTTNGKTQWESPLPDGWEAAVSDDAVYFIDPAGGTQWDFPTEESEA